MSHHRHFAEEGNSQEQFRVSSRVEIIAILRALAADNVLVTVFYGGPERFIVTRLLAVNPQFEEIIFDGVASSAANNAVRYAVDLNVHAFHHHIKITFDSDYAEPTLFEDEPAFRMRLPKSVIRLQRRADYRAKAPVLSAPAVMLPGDGGLESLKVRISDISCGGLSFALLAEKASVERGKIYYGCKLDMPQVGEIEVGIEIRYVGAYKDGAGRPMRRFGCKFLRISSASTTLIQRYINQTDVDRRKTVANM